MTNGDNLRVTTGADLLGLSPVIPVVVVDDADHAVPLAQALLRGGVRVIELTLRPGGYDWRFVPEAGATFTDTGSAACH